MIALDEVKRGTRHLNDMCVCELALVGRLARKMNRDFAHIVDETSKHIKKLNDVYYGSPTMTRLDTPTQVISC